MPTKIDINLEDVSKSLFIIPPKKKFTKIAKNLQGLMITGCKDCTASAYQTYAFCTSLHPDTIITPSKIASILKNIAKKNGGKPKSENTIRQQFAQLEKVGLVEREHLKDRQGKFMGGIWRFFSLQTGDEKLSTGEHAENNKETFEKRQKTTDEKLSTDYNKERVREYKTNHKTNNPPQSPPQDCNTETTDKAGVVDALKSNIKSDKLKSDFSAKTYSTLKRKGLTNGQMKTLISMMNNSNAEGCGWLVWKANDLGPGAIDDQDALLEREKAQLKNDVDQTLEAKKQGKMIIEGFKSGAQMMREALKKGSKVS